MFCLVVLLFSIFVPQVSYSQTPFREETTAERDARMQWWREARFGMFIHWGLYAVPGGVYEGKQESRDEAYHQGTVWPWLLEHFCATYLKIHKTSGLSLVKKLYYGFEEDMNVNGIGSVSEIYDGDPPHTGRGAISQAWSVAALLRIRRMIKNYSTEIA